MPYGSFLLWFHFQSTDGWEICGCKSDFRRLCSEILFPFHASLTHRCWRVGPNLLIRVLTLPFGWRTHSPRCSFHRRLFTIFSIAQNVSPTPSHLCILWIYPNTDIGGLVLLLHSVFASQFIVVISNWFCLALMHFIILTRIYCFAVKFTCTQFILFFTII